MADIEDIDQLKRAMGLRLQAARRTAGLTQEQAADLLGKALDKDVHGSRIANYEQGTRLPDPVVVTLLCRIYGASPAAVYGLAEGPISTDEAALLEKYRQTDERGRRQIQGVADAQPVYLDSPGRIGTMKAAG